MAKEKPTLRADSLALDDWLEHVLTPEHKRKVLLATYQFPTVKHRDEFLNSIHTRSDQTIKALLRSFLISGGTLGIDDSTRRWVWSMSDEELTKLLDEYEFIRRLVEPPFLPWDGTMWILDLLPHYPAKALDVLGAYFTAHCQFLPDGRANGLSDAEAIIRKRYLHCENPREALLVLRPDEFECLIGALYEKLGYKVTVTQTSRDGGVDIEARRTDAGGQALVLIQCKRYEDVVRVQAVRELMGVVSRRQANKGVLVATCGFTPPAWQEASSTPMIELIDFQALNKLLNQNFGAKWPDYMTYDIRRVQMAHAKSRTSKAT